MNKQIYKVLVVASHPVQYAVPLYRLMAKHPQLDVKVAYCSLQGVENNFDSGFGINVSWDIPLLDGYQWQQMRNNSPQPKLGVFWGLINWELWKLITTEDFDAVVIYTGYNYLSFWIAFLACKLRNTKFLFSTDASTIEPRNKNKLKTLLKKVLLPPIFKLADMILVSSSPGRNVVANLGIKNEKIILTPFTVDNDWWLSQKTLVNTNQIRKDWNIPINSKVILFCAKLQPWKAPLDLLRAFALADLTNSYLVFAGEGPLRQELEAESKILGVEDKVRFLGFVNQSQLPSVYTSADLFVLPSTYEPFGVVVNEAMLCGCPVIVSDKVGAGYDLVVEGKTGFVYTAGDIQALSDTLKRAMEDENKLKEMGIAATERMKTWSPEDNINALIEGIKKSLDTSSSHDNK